MVIIGLCISWWIKKAGRTISKTSGSSSVIPEDFRNRLIYQKELARKPLQSYIEVQTELLRSKELNKEERKQLAQKLRRARDKIFKIIRAINGLKEDFERAYPGGPYQFTYEADIVTQELTMNIQRIRDLLSTLE